MKKLISIILATLMVLSLTAPMSAMAAEHTYEKYPIIYIRGNGNNIFTPDGERVYTEFEVFTDESDDDENAITTDTIVETALNILLPFLAGGMLNDEWEAYGDALYEELAPLWDKAVLDGNGNPKYGTQVSQTDLNYWTNQANYDHGLDGYYDIYDYSFVYDWRLSPYDHVDRLDEFIHGIMDVTGAKQVCIASFCMGGSLLSAYLEKYGGEGYVKKVFYSEVLSNGCSFISDTFSGKVKLNDKAMQTFLKQAEYIGAHEDINGVGFALSEMLSEFVGRTMDLFTQTGVIDTVLGGLEGLYSRLYQEFIPAVCLAAGLATYPNYWASVYEEDFDTALNLIFGEEGSELRTEYAGLIEKIQYYREHVSADLPGFYEKISKDYGIEVGVLANYGYLSAPFTEHYGELSDALVGLQDASFGATTSTVFTTLSDDYIQSRIDAGYEYYISPDKQIDASTAFFPDTTWYVKNAHHSNYTGFEKIALSFLRYSNTTNKSNMENMPIFSVYTGDANNPIVPMSEDNMAPLEFMTTAEQKPTTETKLMSFFRWLTTIFNLIGKFLRGEISFSGMFE